MRLVPGREGEEAWSQHQSEPRTSARRSCLEILSSDIMSPKRIKVMTWDVYALVDATPICMRRCAIDQ